MASPRFDWITFDCYGTLIDWERGIFDAFTAQAAREGRRAADRGAVLEAYHALEPEAESKSYRRYRDILAVTAERVAARLDWPLPPERAGFLAESLPSWPPFPDTNPALERLSAAGVKLGILSNIDEDLLAATRRHFEVEFALIVTAEQVRSYKPAHGHFLLARDRIGRGARWLHAAQSDFHDVVPCRQLRIPVAWVNRKGEAEGPAGPPDLEFRDLAGVTDWVLSKEAGRV